MANLSGAVAKTMNFVFADIETSTNEAKKRITTLKDNIGKIANIALDEIETNENVRKSIDTESESFLRLVESVRKYGVLENVVVQIKLNKKETDYRLVCVAGHRRILAAKTVGTIKKIPCLLQMYGNEGDSIGTALAENLNREDLHCLDVADGYNELVSAGWSDEDLSQHFCRDIRTIKHYLKISSWPDDIKDLIRKNPKVLSTRVVMRQLAYRKFNSTAELKTAVKQIIAPKPKTNAKISASKHVASTITVADKKQVKNALTDYLSKQKLLSSVIKDEIKKAFIELKLI